MIPERGIPMPGRGPKFARKLGRKLRLPAAYLRSWRAARGSRDLFAGIERFCLFIGYPRSGHSLVGSLLDAHPEMIIAHELHVLRYLRYGFGRDQIFALLLERSRAHAEAGRSATGYSYAVPNQWQGRFRHLRVIGDKRGGTSIRKLSARPQLLARLRQRIGLPLRLVHVVRNPYDNVATIYRRGRSRDLAESIDHYFRMVAGVERLRAGLPPGEILDVRHDDLLDDPARELVRLCGFLGVEAPPHARRDRLAGRAARARGQGDRARPLPGGLPLRALKALESGPWQPPIDRPRRDGKPCVRRGGPRPGSRSSPWPSSPG
jgi:hypothetical protein